MRTTYIALLLLAVLALPSVVFSQEIAFAPPRTLPVSQTYASPFFLPLDINGNGKTDLAFLGPSASPAFYAYIGNGAGGFSSTPVPLKFFGPDSPTTNGFPTFMDVNGDGISDAVLILPGFFDQLGFEGEFEVWIGDGKGNFKSTFRTPLPHGAYFDSVATAVGDFNGDGRLDIAILINEPGNRGELMIYLNTGGGAFRLVEDKIFSAYPTQLVVGDFNGDGRLDLAWNDTIPQGSSQDSFILHYRYGVGDGSFGKDHTYTVDGIPYSMAAYDFNHDGKTDLVIGTGPKLNEKGDAVPGAQPRIVTLLAKRGGGFTWYASHAVTMTPATMYLADLNGDFLPDVAISEYGPQKIEFLPGLPGGSFGHSETLPAGVALPVLTPLEKGGLPALFYAVVPSSNKNAFDIELRTNTNTK